jgi:branched-chain amino acid transport system ATP-binding protein
MMLEVSDLKSGYGRLPVLMGISLSVGEAEYLGILGHNGMGKTTLMRALMGFLPATGGRVQFGGTDITKAPPHLRVRQGIGYVPQGREIFPGLTVMDNLRMGCAVAPHDTPDVIEVILTEFPRLKRLLDRQGGALSGGEQQLLALARCLCGAPRLILLDEPTEGIQPSIIEEIEETLLRLRSARGIAIILVEQNLEFIQALSQRVLVIQKGTITGELSPAELRDPEIVAEFVGVAA